MPSPSRIGVPCLKRDKRNDLELFLAQRRPVALRVLDQLVGFGDPQRLAATLQPIVQNDASDLAALAGPGAIAKIKASAKAHRILGGVRRGGDAVKSLVDEEGAGEMTAVRVAGVDDALELRVGQRSRTR